MKHKQPVTPKLQADSTPRPPPEQTARVEGHVPAEEVAAGPRPAVSEPRLRAERSRSWATSPAGVQARERRRCRGGGFQYGQDGLQFYV